MRSSFILVGPLLAKAVFEINFVPLPALRSLLAKHGCLCAFGAEDCYEM